MSMSCEMRHEMRRRGKPSLALLFGRGALAHVELGDGARAAHEVHEADGALHRHHRRAQGARQLPQAESAHRRRQEREAIQNCESTEFCTIRTRITWKVCVQYSREEQSELAESHKAPVPLPKPKEKKS